MPFTLSRRVGDAFEINGVLVEISSITRSKAILTISSSAPFEVRYKDLGKHAKRDAVEDAHNRAVIKPLRKSNGASDENARRACGQANQRAGDHS